VGAVWELDGPEQARALYMQLLRRPVAGGQLFVSIITREMKELLPQLVLSLDSNSVPSTSQDYSVHVANGPRLCDAPNSAESIKRAAAARQRLQHLFGAALNVYGEEDVELWLLQCKYDEAVHGNAGMSYWKAIKTLKDPQPFVLRAAP
jgi:hypothetical protein